MIRDYMVSVWTLQDSFITVLKPSGSEMRGKDWIQNPETSLKDDAMNTFSFSIPMYIDKGVENPNWCNVINGTIMEALRKVKVIFHPHTDKEKVFEFVITKVTERHESEQCFCDVECEDAIFHELGKKGYKLSLTPEDFEVDHELWEKGELKDRDGNLVTDEPVATIQYWNDKIFGSQDNPIRGWEYSVEMDYSYQTERTANDGGLATDKIYEDPYVASWEVQSGALVATKTEYEKEKARTTFSITESNIYNATQEIAEAFGVFCRYEYTHDSQYYITGRRVIYYNNYIKEKGEVIEDDGEGNITVKSPLIDITYPYETKAISREMDGTDVITKMYVQQVDDALTDAGTVTITDVAANKTKEDYLMNFDYLYRVGGLNETQYAAIKEFEVQIRELNEQIQGYQALLAQRETTKTALEAKIKGYDDRIVAANKQIDDMNQYIANLNNSDQDTDPTTVLIDPSTGGGIVLVQNSTQPARKLLKNRTKAIVLPSEHSKGITSSTLLEVYETYSGGNLSNLVAGTKKKFNNEGALQEVYNIPDKYAGSPYNGRLYVKYKYRPGLYYERVRNLYTRELTKVTQWREKKQNTLRKLNNRIANTTNALNAALAQKEKLLLNFEKMMGSALREGYWNPENYTDYGNSYTSQVTVDVQSAQYIPSTRVDVTDDSGLLDFNWYNAFKDNGIKETNTSTNYKYSKNTTGTKHGYLAGSGTTVDNFLESYTRSDVFEEGQQIAYYNLFGFVWDEIENKPKIHYNVNTKCFYPYVKLDNDVLYQIRKYLVEDGGSLTDLVFRFYDSTLDGGTGSPPGIGFAVGSEAIFAFVEGVPTESNTDKLCLFPVFILTGTESCSFDTIGDRSLGLNGYLYSTAGGTRTMYLSYWDADNQQYENIWEVNLNASGVQANETYIVCNKSQKYAVWYPCITIDSLRVKKSGDESGLTITLNDQALTEFEDFSMIPYIHTSIDDNDDIVTDNKEYVIIKSDTLLKYGLKETEGVSERARFNLTFNINYTISNADTAIYLDALQVLKENSIPKVSYNVDLSVVNTDLLDTAYNLLGTIANINDTTLKFENIQGYVSEVDLKLDMPWEDSVVLKNYKNKFEDLFSKIVAETSAMQKNAYTVGFAAAALTTSGELKEETLQATINNADLNYAFNNGTLTIDEVNGITGTSEDGIVAMRGGGIFTANQKDENGDWIWNTGILPSGINADLITSGRIDTNQIRLFGGQDLRFIWDEHGLVAYRPAYDNTGVITNIDTKQYVVHNGDGLNLIAEPGAQYTLEGTSDSTLTKVNIVFSIEDIQKLFGEYIPEQEETGPYEFLRVNLGIGDSNYIIFYSDQTYNLHYGDTLQNGIWDWNDEDTFRIKASTDNSYTTIEAEDGYFNIIYSNDTASFSQDQFIILSNNNTLGQDYKITFYYGGLCSFGYIATSNSNEQQSESEEEEEEGEGEDPYTYEWQTWTIEDNELIIIIDNNSYTYTMNNNNQFTISYTYSTTDSCSFIINGPDFIGIIDVSEQVIPEAVSQINFELLGANTKNGALTAAQLGLVTGKYCNKRDNNYVDCYFSYNAVQTVYPIPINDYFKNNSINTYPDGTEAITGGYSYRQKSSSTQRWFLIEQTADASAITTNVYNGSENLKRVEIGWDGLVLRNWNGQKVLYADPNSGDLAIRGAIYATSLMIGTEDINDLLGGDVTRIDGTKLTVDTNAGTIVMKSNNSVNISGGTVKIMSSTSSNATSVIELSKSGIVMNSGSITMNASSTFKATSTLLTLQGGAGSELKFGQANATEINDNGIVGSKIAGDIITASNYMKINGQYAVAGNKKFHIYYSTSTSDAPPAGNKSIWIRRVRHTNSSGTVVAGTRTFSVKTSGSRISAWTGSGTPASPLTTGNMLLAGYAWGHNLYYVAKLTNSTAEALATGTKYTYTLTVPIYNASDKKTAKVYFQIAKGTGSGDVIYTTSSQISIGPQTVYTLEVTLKDQTSKTVFGDLSQKALNLYIRAGNSTMEGYGTNQGDLFINSSSTITLTATSTNEVSGGTTYTYDISYVP